MVNLAEIVRALTIAGARGRVNALRAGRQR
jgi:hypothetical protein